jgi:hypothetical protein
MPDTHAHRRSPEIVEIAAWLLMAAGLVLVLRLHLLSALLAGLLVFQLVHIISPILQRHLSGRGPQMVAVAFLSAAIIGLITAMALGTIVFMRSEGGSFTALLQKMAEILESARGALP